MNEELTPAEKRKRTMLARYGEQWAKKNGQAAKDGRIAKRGEETYREQQSSAARKANATRRPETRPFKNKDLAVSAGKKGSDRRWGKNEQATTEK